MQLTQALFPRDMVIKSPFEDLHLGYYIVIVASEILAPYVIIIIIIIIIGLIFIV